MDCLDCKRCKVTVSRGILRCRAGHWRKETNGEERIIKLTLQEMKTLHIAWRNTFLLGMKCSSMISMV